MMSLKIGYRIQNCIMNLCPLFLAFIFRLGSLNFFSKSFLLQLLFCLLIPIWNSFVSVVIFIGLRLSEWYNRICENWAGVR